MRYAVDVLPAAEVETADWALIQDLHYRALESELPVRYMQPKIRELLEMDDPAHYAASHVDPNVEVGGRFRNNQAFYDATIAVATTPSDEVVGFMYGAENVSGSEFARKVKRLSVAKRYLWLREIAVTPEHRRRGVATMLGRSLLQKFDLNQPVSAYVWKDLTPAAYQLLTASWGMRETGSEAIDPFGDGELIEQVRLQADYVSSVLNQLESNQSLDK